MAALTAGVSAYPIAPDVAATVASCWSVVVRSQRTNGACFARSGAVQESEPVVSLFSRTRSMPGRGPARPTRAGDDLIGYAVECARTGRPTTSNSDRDRRRTDVD